jgi:macrolide transport system ATP-binding/permease protein
VLHDRPDLFESVASIFDNEGSLTAPDVMRSVKAASITDNFFETLGVHPLLGRTVSHVNHGSQFMNGVNISYDVWQKDFHGDPQIVGRRIEVNNTRP